MLLRLLTATVVGCLAVISCGCGGPPAPDSPETASPSSTADADPRGEQQTELVQTSADSEPAEDPADDSQADPREARVSTPQQLIDALKAKNPGFGGNVQLQPMNAELMALVVNDKSLKDISPLARQRIGALDLSGCDIQDLDPLQGLPLVALYMEDNPRISDIGALRGMPLQEIYLSKTSVSNLAALRGAPLNKFNAVGADIRDLSPLSDSPLEMIWLSDCPVEDISPLSKLPLVSLTLENTKVRDISPLAGNALQRLHIGGCAVADLRPIAKMPRLTRLIFDPARVEQGLDVVRQMPTLTELGTNFDNRVSPVVFWEQLDQQTDE